MQKLVNSLTGLITDKELEISTQLNINKVLAQKYQSLEKELKQILLE